MSLPVPTEDFEQRSFVQWLRLKGLPHFRVPNETYTKSFSQKAKNKALGVVPGVPDLFVVIPGKCLVGIEMKRVKRSVTAPAQLEWQATLNQIPNVEVFITKGCDAAIQVIENLLDSTPLPTVISPVETF